MAGHGLPLDPELADRWSQQISHSKRIVWEVEPDTEGKSEEALMKFQCEKALALAKAGRIQGIVFLTVNNDPDMILWTRDWIKTAAKQPQ